MNEIGILYAMTIGLIVYMGVSIGIIKAEIREIKELLKGE